MRSVSLLLLFLGIGWMGYAIRGIARRRITTYPRGARGSTYEGRAAVLQGLVELLLGFVSCTLGLVLYLSG